MSSHTTPETASVAEESPKTGAGRKEWIGLGVLLLVCLLIAMDMGVLYLAVPMISADLAPSGTQQLWIMDIYGLILAGLMIPMGALGDRMGRRLLLLVGAGAFGLAAVISAFSVNPEMLIAARALQGVAGATLMPCSLALIRHMFHDAQQRRTAIGIWTAGTSSGAALGPIVGGILLNNYWWGSVFLISVPAIVLLLILGPILLPEVRKPDGAAFDLVSAVLALGAVLPMIYGIKGFAAEGLSVVPVVSMVLGVAFGYGFLRRQRIMTEPVLNLELFRNRGFSTGLVLNLLAMFVMLGFTQFSMQYVQLVAGLPPLDAALWTLPAPLGMIVAASTAATMARMLSRNHVLSGGFLISALGTVLMSQARADSPLAMIILAATLIATGVGVVLALVADLIISSADPQRAGAAAATSETSKEFGGAIGTAILGSIGAIAYTAYMDGFRSPDVPPEALAAARETLGGAAGAAEQLGPKAAGTLMETASAAFVHQMNVAAIAATTVLVAGAIVATVWLRRVPDTAPTEESAEDEAAEPAVAG